MNFREKMVAAAAMLSISGCATGTISYQPPIVATYGNTVVVDQSYDETWESLISYAAATFFAIDNFEKESGLLTLSFGAGDISKYVDCGSHNADPSNYADFIAFHRDANLSGVMNLVIRPIDQTSTQVVVSARYVVSMPALRGRGTITSYYAPAVTWVFDSKSSATELVSFQTDYVNQSVLRTCQPTGVAEKAILDGVAGLGG